MYINTEFTIGAHLTCKSIKETISVEWYDSINRSSSSWCSLYLLPFNIYFIVFCPFWRSEASTFRWRSTLCIFHYISTRFTSTSSIGVVEASSNLRQEIDAQIQSYSFLTQVRLYAKHFSSFRLDSLVNPIHNNSHCFFSTSLEAVECLKEQGYKQLRELEAKSGDRKSVV